MWTDARVRAGGGERTMKPRCSFGEQLPPSGGRLMMSFSVAASSTVQPAWPRTARSTVHAQSARTQRLAELITKLSISFFAMSAAACGTPGSVAKLRNDVVKNER